MLIHEYETIYILPPDLDEAVMERIQGKIETAVTGAGGEILVSEDWGRRKLAYIIRKHQHGVYRYLNYVGAPEVPVQLERQANLEDNLVRYITVRLAESVDVEERRVLAEERRRKREEAAAREARSLEESAARGGRDDRRDRDDRRRGRDDDDGDDSDDDDDDDSSDDDSDESSDDSTENDA